MPPWGAPCLPFSEFWLKEERAATRCRGMPFRDPPIGTSAFSFSRSIMFCWEARAEATAACCWARLPLNCRPAS